MEVKFSELKEAPMFESIILQMEETVHNLIHTVNDIRYKTDGIKSYPPRVEKAEKIDESSTPVAVSVETKLQDIMRQMNMALTSVNEIKNHLNTII